MLKSKTGTTYVEYFLVAGLMAIAAMALFNRLESVAEGTFGGEVDRQMNTIKGPL